MKLAKCFIDMNMDLMSTFHPTSYSHMKVICRLDMKSKMQQSNHFCDINFSILGVEKIPIRLRRSYPLPTRPYRQIREEILYCLLR